MFEWKNLQLECQDYENYITNEGLQVNQPLDPAEYFLLYKQVQLRSLQNSKIKRYILKYESLTKKIFLDQYHNQAGLPQSTRKYEELASEFKTQISYLFQQIYLLQLPNIQSTIEFLFGRLLSLEEKMVRLICNQNITINDLEHKVLTTELRRKSNFCDECRRNIHQARNQNHINEIIALQTPSQQQVSEEPNKEEIKSIRRYLREQARHEQYQSEVERSFYLNSLEEVLKNKDRILKCSSAPLQDMLEQYLKDLLDILQNQKKIVLVPKNIKQFERTNRSYENLEEMKSLVNYNQFYKHVGVLLKRPFDHFMQKVDKYIKNQLKIKDSAFKQAETQTIFIKEYDLIKKLEKQIDKLNHELEALKVIKNNNEGQLQHTLDLLHHHEMSNIQLSSKNKSQEADLKRLQQHISSLKISITKKQQLWQQQEDQNQQRSQLERSNYIKEIKSLETRIKEMNKAIKDIPITKNAEIQTEPGEQKQKTENNLFKQKRKSNIMAKSARLKSKIISSKLNFMKISSNVSPRTKDDLSEIESVLSKRDAKDAKTSNLCEAFSEFEFKHSPKVNGSNEESMLINKKMFLNNTTRGLSIEQPFKQSNQKSMKKIKINHHSELPLYSNDQFIQNINLLKNSSGFDLKAIPEINIKSIKKIQSTSTKFHQRNDSNFSIGANENNLNYSLSKQIIESECFEPLRSTSRLINMKMENELEQKQPVSLKLAEQFKRNIIDEQLSYALKQMQQFEKMPKLQHFIKYCRQNYNQLDQYHIFNIIQDFIPNNIKINQKEQVFFEQQTNIKIEKKDIQIFLNMNEAEKYEKSIGMWGQLDSCLVMDNQFKTISNQISFFFEVMERERPFLYNQIILFLQRPYLFAHSILKNDKQQQQTEVLRYSKQMVRFQRAQISNLFKKLFRIHKMIHRKCYHVQDFLKRIGFLNKK